MKRRFSLRVSTLQNLVRSISLKSPKFFLYLKKDESQDGGIVCGFKRQGEVTKLFIDIRNKIWKKCGRVEFIKIINNNGDFNSTGKKNMSFLLPPSAANICIVCHYVKSVQIRSYFWSVLFCIRIEYFSVFIPNTGKYGPQTNPYLDTFQAVRYVDISAK